MNSITLGPEQRETRLGLHGLRLKATYFNVCVGLGIHEPTTVICKVRGVWLLQAVDFCDRRHDWLAVHPSTKPPIYDVNHLPS